ESNEVCFKDFVLGGGDFVKFVQLKFGLNYFEALSKIAIDFELEEYFNVKNIQKTQKNYNPENFNTTKEKLLASSNRVKIGRKVRDWTLKDLQYWFQYGIPKKTL